MEYAVCTNQLTMILCSIFEQMKETKLHKSIWTIYEKCNINLYPCHMRVWHVILSHEDSEANKIHGLLQRHPCLSQSQS